MTSWTKTLNSAPKDRPILVRLPGWDCPAVMQHETVDDESGWGFVEELLRDVAGWIEPAEHDEAEWAFIPE